MNIVMPVICGAMSAACAWRAGKGIGANIFPRSIKAWYIDQAILSIAQKAFSAIGFGMMAVSFATAKVAFSAACLAASTAAAPYLAAAVLCMGLQELARILS